MTPRLPTRDLVSRPRSHGFHARIGDVYVRLAPSQDQPYVTVAPEPEPPRIDTGQSPEEFLTVEGQAFARSNLTGGEGLAFAHRPSPGPNDRIRFWDSANIRAPLEVGTPRSVDMTNAWREYGTFTNIVNVVTFPSSESVCIVESGTFTVLDDLDGDPNPNVVNSGSFTNTPVLDAAALGDRVYTVNGSTTIEWVDSTGATGSEVVGTESWAKIWAAKGRLFIATATGGNLWEYEPTQPPTELTAERTITSSDAWTSVVDVGEFIAAGATDGRIYLFAPTDAQTPALVLYSSTPMPEGEAVEELAYNQGVLLISTSEVNWDTTQPSNTSPTGRLYTAVVGTSVEDIELVRRWDFEEAPVPRHMFTTRDSVYFTIQDGTTVEVWRMLLPTLGLFREDRFTGNSSPIAGMSNPGQVALVGLTDQVWLETRNATTDDAWLILPAADFFTSEVKAWSEIRVDVGNMPTGAEIDILVSTEYEALLDWMHPSWRTVRTVRSQVTQVTVPLIGVEGRYLIMQIRMRRGATAESPELLSLAATGKVKSDEDVEVVLPVIVSDRIEIPNRKPVHSRGLGDALRQYLTGLNGSMVDVEIYRPRDSVRGWVTGVQGTVNYINRRGHPLDVIQVRMSGRRVTGETVLFTGGVESLGVGLLGVEPTIGGTSA